MATRKRMKTTFNFLIVNMAIGDLLVSLFIMPSEVSICNVRVLPVASLQMSISRYVATTPAIPSNTVEYNFVVRCSFVQRAGQNKFNLGL